MSDASAARARLIEIDMPRSFSIGGDIKLV